MLWMLLLVVGELVAMTVPVSALLAAYLYFRREVQSLGSIIGFIAGGCASFIVALVALQYGRLLPAIIPLADRAGFPGPNAIFYAGCLGGGLLSMSFLILLPGRVSSSRLTREMLVCITVAGLLGPLAFALLDPSIPKSPDPSFGMMLIW